MQRILRSRAWFKVSRNPLSAVGLAIVLAIVISAAFAPWVTPYPLHAGAFVDIVNAGKPPSAAHLFGTDTVGRDIFTRVLSGARMLIQLVTSSVLPPRQISENANVAL